MSDTIIDDTIRDLERLHAVAQDIFDKHIDYVRCRTPTVPFGTLKSRIIAAPAGSALNYIEGLKIVRKLIAG